MSLKNIIERALNQTAPQTIVNPVPSSVTSNIVARVLKTVNGQNGSNVTTSAATITPTTPLFKSGDPKIVKIVQRALQLSANNPPKSEVARVAEKALTIYKHSPVVAKPTPSTGYMSYILHLMKGTTAPEQIPQQIAAEVIAKHGKTPLQLPAAKIAEKVVKAVQQSQCSPLEYLQNECHPTVTNTTEIGTNTIPGNNTQAPLKNVSLPVTAPADKTSTSFVSIALTGLCLFGCVTLIQHLWKTYQASLEERKLQKPSLNTREIVASMHHLTPQESRILEQFTNVMNTHASLKKAVIQELYQHVQERSFGDEGHHKIENQHAGDGG